jgi:hypothetical protein
VELTAQGSDDAAYHTTTDSGGAYPADRPFHVIAAAGTVRLRQELAPLAELSGRVLESDARAVEKAAVECLGSSHRHGASDGCH